MNEPTPYAELNGVLAELVGEVRATIGEKFVGAYLQGSFAVGDFDANSDVDFIVVTSDELSAAEVPALTAMHEEIYRLSTPWAQHLEGSYFSRGVLQTHQPGEELWYLDHGSQVLVRSDHCNTLVVRWIVREQVVTLTGPAPATLLDPIPVERLRREISTTLHNWGKDILADPTSVPEPVLPGLHRAELLSNAPRSTRWAPEFEAGRCRMGEDPFGCRVVTAHRPCMEHATRSCGVGSDGARRS